jgi:DNA-binding response OmpR family regulator
MKPAHILIVDDEPNIRLILEHALRREGYLLDTAANGSEAIAKIQQACYDLIILDLHMQPVDGMHVFNVLHQQDPDAVVIILTAHGSMDSAVQALRLGAFDYLFKPATPDAIRQRVREGLRHRQEMLHKDRLLEQVGKLRQMLNEMPGVAGSEQAQPVLLDADQRFLVAGSLITRPPPSLCHPRRPPVELTTAEYNFLLCLAQAAPQPVAHHQLVHCALGYDCKEIGAPGCQVAHPPLAPKIGPDPDQPSFIKTIRYQGYLWSGK